MCKTNSELEHLPAENALPAPLASRSPLKFWQIEERFRCPVIGICLTPSEQKHLLRKAGVSIKNNSPHEIHELLVASAQSENRVSQKVDRLLNHKYGRHAAELNRLEGNRSHGSLARRFSDRTLPSGILGSGQPAGFVAGSRKGNIRGDPHVHARRRRPERPHETPAGTAEK
jgi:hypothetical protein